VSELPKLPQARMYLQSAQWGFDELLTKQLSGDAFCFYRDWHPCEPTEAYNRRAIMVDFSYENVPLIERIKTSKEGRWLYRGQAHDWRLTSTLERHARQFLGD